MIENRRYNYRKSCFGPRGEAIGAEAGPVEFISINSTGLPMKTNPHLVDSEWTIFRNERRFNPKL